MSTGVDKRKRRWFKITENVRAFFMDGSLVQTKTCKRAYLFDLSNRNNSSSFEVLSQDVLINGHYL